MFYYSTTHNTLTKDKQVKIEISLQHGVVSCRPPHCPALNCTDPNPPDPSRGICCPSCKGNLSLQRDQILQSYLVK